MTGPSEVLSEYLLTWVERIDREAFGARGMRRLSRERCNDEWEWQFTYRLPGYAYVAREGAAIRMREEPGRNLRLEQKLRVTVYIDVADVDALHSELRTELATLPAGDVEPPDDTSYGAARAARAFSDGQWLVFGQPIQSRHQSQD